MPCRSLDTTMETASLTRTKHTPNRETVSPSTMDAPGMTRVPSDLLARSRDGFAGAHKGPSTRRPRAGRFQTDRMIARQSELDSRIGAITSHIVRRLADAAVEDMRARYDFGRVLLTLRSESRNPAGAGVLRLLANQLEVDPSALRRYAQ